jgi:hypothetical protein
MWHRRIIAVYNKHDYHNEINTNVSNTDRYEQVTTKENRENVRINRNFPTSPAGVTPPVFGGHSLP